MRIRTMAILFMACLAIMASQSGAASDNDAWQYEVTPYFLGAGLDGTAGIRGVEADIDMSFSDILDNLDAGLMGVFSAQKGPWTFGLEGVYFKLKDEATRSVSGPFGQVSVNGALELTTSMYIYQGTAGYRILDDKTEVDLLGALRYTKLATEANVAITTTPGIVFPGGALSAKGSESWTDAVIGTRIRHPVSEQVSLVGYADIGAGGSDLTYQIIFGANWEFREDFIAKLGYRYMYWDYEESGTVWDMTASGPYLGLGIRF